MKLKYPYTPYILLTLIYVFLYNDNTNIDSWYYAACVKHGHELFNSHHLIYNYFARLIYVPLHSIFPSLEALRSLQIMNALAAFFSLIVLHKILLLIEHKKNVAYFLTLFCGVSFGFMRYATDAETYILPVLFSLLSTYSIIKAPKTYELLKAGLFSAIAIAFHQLHIWWTLSLVLYIIYRRDIKMKDRSAFILPLFLVPIAYIMVYNFAISEKSGFVQFVTGTYSSGASGLDISPQSWILAFAGFIRTFVQVHGDVIRLGELYPYAWVCLTCVIVILLTFSLFKTDFKLLKHENRNRLSIYLKAGFGMHFLFALLSSGNAEFMVMLPFMFVLITALDYAIIISMKHFLFITALFLWNTGNGLLPARCLPLLPTEKQTEFCLTETDAVYFWTDKPLIENRLDYMQGFNDSFTLFSTVMLENSTVVSEFFREGKAVYTDLGIRKTDFSREGYLNKKHSMDVLHMYKSEIVDSFMNIYGKNYIYRLLPKE